MPTADRRGQNPTFTGVVGSPGCLQRTTSVWFAPDQNEAGLLFWSKIS